MTTRLGNVHIRCVNAVLPVACAGCGRPGGALCRQCVKRAKRPPASLCRPLVGSAMPVLAPFEYSGVIRDLVMSVKYRNSRQVLPWLARAIADACVAECIRVDVVTWAPTTRQRRRSRGFDHAEQLAVAIGAFVGIPALGLIERAGGPAQTGRSAVDRRTGPTFLARVPIAGERVLLVDDVLTTGATLLAASAVLRCAGASDVIGAVAARTPRPNRPERAVMRLKVRGRSPET